ncbi:RNase H family protein [Spatholobus suberectus]|nr:RNase H family protein [Spatholobus suberectus]
MRQERGVGEEEDANILKEEDREKGPDSAQSGALFSVMNCLLQLSSYTAAIVGSSARLIANRSLHRCSFPTKSEYRGIRSFHSGFVSTTRCYSTKKGRKGGSSRLHKAEPEVPVMMEQEKDAFYVVRKGDVVGIYSSLTESQAQVGSSVCNPPVSVYKGYSLSKDTEEYLVSHGLKNALYTIRAADLKEDLFGMLVPCPFQEPSTKEGTSNKDVSKKRSLGVLRQDNEKVISEDPLRKQVKLDHAVVAEAPSHATRTCILEFDGASKGNPGKAGAGAILRANDGSLICRLREGVGVATNNAAEYRAMILGMRYALKKGFTGIRIQGDSKLVCMQIDGSWKVKNENLSTLYNVAKELKDKFSSFQISHVLRNFNSDADAQANLATNLVDGQVQEECVG